MMADNLGYGDLGKWHLGMDPVSQPKNQGYDSYFGILNSTDEALFAVSLAQAGYEPTAAERAYVWSGGYHQFLGTVVTVWPVSSGDRKAQEKGSVDVERRPVYRAPSR